MEKNIFVPQSESKTVSPERLSQTLNPSLEDLPYKTEIQKYRGLSNNLRTNEEALMKKIEECVLEIENFKKRSLELSKIQENYENTCLSQEKSLINLNSEIEELNKKIKNLSQKFSENSEKKLKIQKEILNFKELDDKKKNMPKALMSEEAKSINEEIIMIKNQIKEENSKFESALKEAKENYEDKLRTAKYNAKLAKFVEIIEYRSISYKSKSDCLVTKEKLEEDLISISENDEEIRKSLLNSVYMLKNPDKKLSSFISIEKHKNASFNFRYFLVFLLGWMIGKLIFHYIY